MDLAGCVRQEGWEAWREVWGGEGSGGGGRRGSGIWRLVGGVEGSGGCQGGLVGVAREAGATGTCRSGGCSSMVTISTRTHS